jgi:hypothetical protein
VKIAHFIITWFSVRGPGWREKFDPLNPQDLEFRFKLFEITCLPSILGQTNQGFVWVIIIDKDLQPKYLRKMRDFISVRPASVLHTYNPGCNYSGLKWLEGYLSQEPHYVLTTNHDDDDSLPRGYVNALQAEVRKSELKHELIPLAILGAKDIVQWDLITSDDAPLGWKCPWHRTIRVSSCGFSLSCLRGAYDFSVQAVKHSAAENYLAFNTSAKNEYIESFRRLVKTKSAQKGIDVESWRAEDTFHDLSPTIGPVLMTNHFTNNQAGRLYEKKPSYTKVSGPESFPEFDINWSIARRYSAEFHSAKSILYHVRKKII